MRIRFVGHDGSDFYEDLDDTRARLIKRARPEDLYLDRRDPPQELRVKIDVYRRERLARRGRIVEIFYQYDSTL